MSDQRGSRRSRVLKGTKISFGGGAISCTVRNVTVSGAQRAADSSLGIPTEFVLVIPSGGMSRPCPGHLEVRQWDKGAVRGGRAMKLSRSLSSLGIPPVLEDVDAMNVGNRTGRSL